MEIEYICKHTIGTSTNATNEYWMMMGDFNSRNRTDNAVYKYPEDSPMFLTQDYIAQETPYVDIIAKSIRMNSKQQPVKKLALIMYTVRNHYMT